jgi:hypothetical protein
LYNPAAHSHRLAQEGAAIGSEPEFIVTPSRFLRADPDQAIVDTDHSARYFVTSLTIM